MIATRLGTGLATIMLITVCSIRFQSAMASDELPRSLRIPLVSKERIPIGKVLAHPDHYQMREIRLIGTVAAIQTETITNRMACGLAHERTTILVGDDSGRIEVMRFQRTQISAAGSFREASTTSHVSSVYHSSNDDHKSLKV